MWDAMYHCLHFLVKKISVGYRAQQILVKQDQFLLVVHLYISTLQYLYTFQEELHPCQ